jgi:hypothetical protein
MTKLVVSSHLTSFPILFFHLHSQAMWLPLLIALLLVGGARATPARDCTTTTQMAARRMTADDGVVSTTIYAGHHYKPLALNVRWQQHTASAATTGTFIVHPNHSLVGSDIPTGWFDGQSSMTLERLFFSTRAATRHWHVSTGPTPALNTALLYLGADSPLWLSHDAVVFSGAHLHFMSRRPGADCSAIEALGALAADSSQHATLWLDTPVKHRLTVFDGVTGNLIGTWNVTLRSGPDVAQTLIPPDAADALLLGAKHELVLDDRVLIATGHDLAVGWLVAADTPDFSHTVMQSAGHAPASEMHLTLSRRLLQRIGVAWAVDANGHMAVRLVTSSFEEVVGAASASPIDAVPEGVYWVAAIVGLILVWLTAFWTSHLGSTLQLIYSARDAPEGAVVVTKLDIACGFLVLALSVIVHVLMLVYGGHDALYDSSLEAPLRIFIYIFSGGSLAAGGLFLAVQLIEIARELRGFAGTRAYRIVSVQLFAVLMGAITSRGVLAALLLGAGTTMAQMAVTCLAVLAFVFFPAVYSALVLLVHLLAGVPLFLPRPPKSWPREPAMRPRRAACAVEGVAVVVVVAVALSLGVAFPLYFLNPFFDTLNSYYTPQLVLTVALTALSVPLFAAAFSINEAAKRVLKRAMRRFEARRNSKLLASVNE